MYACADLLRKIVFVRGVTSALALYDERRESALPTTERRPTHPFPTNVDPLHLGLYDPGKLHFFPHVHAPAFERHPEAPHVGPAEVLPRERELDEVRLDFFRIDLRCVSVGSGRKGGNGP
jgi:hypothetical protein